MDLVVPLGILMMLTAKRTVNILDKNGVMRLIYGAMLILNVLLEFLLCFLKGQHMKICFSIQQKDVIISKLKKKFWKMRDQYNVGLNNFRIMSNLESQNMILAS